MVCLNQERLGRPAGLRRAASAFAESGVEGRGVGGGIALEGADGGAGSGEAMGGGEGGCEVELEVECGGATLGGLDVADDLVAVELVVVGQDVGVGHVDDFEAEDAGLLLLVDEGGVGEFGEPSVVVEGGVVDAVGSFGADVGGRDAEVLDEGGVVGAGAEGADVNVGVGLALRGVGAGLVGRSSMFPWLIRRRRLRPCPCRLRRDGLRRWPGRSSTGRRRCRLWERGPLWSLRGRRL